jgi:hypothetical protein
MTKGKTPIKWSCLSSNRTLEKPFQNNQLLQLMKHTSFGVCSVMKLKIMQKNGIFSTYFDRNAKIAWSSESLSILCCVYVLVCFVLCTLCWQVLWIVPSFCVPYVDRFSGLSLRFVYPMLTGSLDCPFVLCTLCWQVLWIVHFRLPLQYSLTFIKQVLLISFTRREAS